MMGITTQGWATGRFGLFGVNVEPVTSSSLNYGGVLLAVATLAILMFVQPEVSGRLALAITLASGHTWCNHCVVQAQLRKRVLMPSNATRIIISRPHFCFQSAQAQSAQTIQRYQRGEVSRGNTIHFQFEMQCR